MVSQKPMLARHCSNNLRITMFLHDICIINGEIFNFFFNYKREVGWGYGLVCKSLAMKARRLELDFQSPHKIIWHGDASFYSQHRKADDEQTGAFEADELLIEAPTEVAMKCPRTVALSLWGSSLIPCLCISLHFSCLEVVPLVFCDRDFGELYSSKQPNTFLSVLSLNTWG